MVKDLMVAKYQNTEDSKDVVTLDEIIRRYVGVNGTVDGFEDYVNSGFRCGNEVEYKEVNTGVVAKVRLTYSVELDVRGDNEEQIQEWLNGHTPDGAVRLANGHVTEDYGDEMICCLDPNTTADVDIRKVK